MLNISRRRSSFLPALVTILLAPLISTVDALPRFAVDFKQNCQLCHHNPAGGGMRTLYGAQFFSYMELANKGETDFENLEKYRPKLNDNFQIGADFRSLFYSLDGDVDMKSFLAMQGDVYFAVTPTDNTMIYLEKGIGLAFETYGLLRGLPLGGAIKVGQFVPNYGWRFADHKSYVRDFLGFSQYFAGGFGRRSRVIEDQGVEFGFYPMEWEWSVSLTNGSTAAPDNNKGKVATTRALKRFSLGGLNVTFGGSYRYGEFGDKTAAVTRYAGGLWGLNYGAVTYIGETDWAIDDEKTSLAATHLGVIHLLKGIDLSLGFDYYDDDVHRQTLGFDYYDDDVHRTDHAWRGKLGSELYLTGYMELAPAVYWHEEFGTTWSTAEMQLHLWF